MSFAMVAGGVMSLAGSSMQGRAAEKANKAELAAARENRGFVEQKTDIGQLWQLAQLMGGPQAVEQFKAFLTPEQRDLYFGRAARAGNFTDQDRADLAAVEKQIADLRNTPGGLMGTGTQRDALNKRIQELTVKRAELLKKAEGDPGQSALLDEEAIKKIPGLLSKYQGLADEAGRQRTSNLAGYDAATSGLDRQARDLQRQAANFGQQERSRIERDSDRALTVANRQATSALMGRGLGASTALTDAYRGNAEGVGRMREDALGSLGDRQIQLQTGLGTGRLGLLSGRAAGRDAMSLGGQDVERSLRMGALNVQQAGTQMPSWLGTNTQQFFPGNAPSAASAYATGSALTGVGGQMMGYGMMNAYLNNLNKPANNDAPNNSLGNLTWTPNDWYSQNGAGNAMSSLYTF